LEVQSIIRSGTVLSVHPASHPLFPAECHLRAADPLIACLIDRYGACELANRSHSHFHMLVKTIIDQQLSVKVARRIAERLLILQEGESFEPWRLLRLNDEQARSAGLSRSKVRYIRELARAVHTGKLDFMELGSATDEEIIRTLVSLPGIGCWTAEVFMMFSLHRLDVLPLGDLALRNAIKRHYRLDEKAPRSDYITLAEKWRPYRSIACWYLWAAVDS
jgi:DNA-3-methyladenine glycosylase II